MKDWFAKTTRQVFAAGPLLPAVFQTAASELAESSKALEITQFLDQVLMSHGKKSVLYVRAHLHICVVRGLI